MKVLIVNGYGKNPKGDKAFKNFVSITKKSFEFLKACGMEDPTFVILDSSNIEKYTMKDSREATQLFDSVDFVLTDGDANLLPWSRRARKLGIFFKQCKRADKALFAAGYAFYMLIYYCATNFAPINVVNGREWGSKFDAIHTFPTSKLTSESCFLDNETGDIYVYNPDSSKWNPIANAGLHYTRNASTAAIGQFVQKVKVYRGAPKIRDIYDVFTSSLNEAICYIKKAHVQHYAFIGLPQRFLVTAMNAWDPHPVNVTAAALVGPNYTTLAENEHGASIVEHRHTIATLFHINSKHLETVTILENFVKMKMIEIQTKGKIGIPLEVVEMEERSQLMDPDWKQMQGKKIEELAKKHKIAINTIENRSKSNYTKEFKRSGLSYSKRLQALVVDNNTVRSSVQAAEQAKESRWGVPQLEKQPPSQTLFTSRNTIQKLLPKQQSASLREQMRPGTSGSLNQAPKYLFHPASNFFTTPRKGSPYQSAATLKNNSASNIALKTSSSARIKRAALHPPCRFREFEKLSQKITSPCIRTSSHYETIFEREKREEKESRKKWISPDSFQTVFKNGIKPNFIPNYVFRDPSDPPALHEFRIKEKGKWIAGTFKL